MRRPDTRFGCYWIARLGGSALVAVALPTVLAVKAEAQILGTTNPGTPGALQGELRATAPRPLPESPSAPVRYTGNEFEQAPGTRKFGLKRQPNTAIRKQFGSGQSRATGLPGASPGDAIHANGSDKRPNTTGARFSNPVDANATMPKIGQPIAAIPVSPGLPPVMVPTPKRLPAEDDPFAPTGLRAGTMILRPAIEVDGGYDSNATRSALAPKSSAFYRTEVELTGKSDWAQHQLDLSLRGAFTGYTAVNNANRPEGDARIALRLDVTRELVVDSALTAKLDTENSTSVNLPGGTTGRTLYYQTGLALGATRSFGRFSLSLRGTLDRLMYGDASVATGTVSQIGRDYNTYGLRLRAGYEITPGIQPFVEVGTDQRIHDVGVDSSGYRRDSFGMIARVGSSFELARTLTGEAAIGYTLRDYEDTRLTTMKAPLVDGSLTWSISPLTALNVRAQSEIAETTIAGSSGARVYRGTTTLTHAFLRNFTAIGSLGYQVMDYDRLNRKEETLTAGMKLEYKFNRLLAARAGYTFERLHVNAPGEDYRAHVFTLGLRMTR